MAKTVGIGIQDFEKIIREDVVYIDKTLFIKEWWESKDEVTLIARPRRFGKTLNMSMLERFFSNRYTDQAELFDGLKIWEEKTYRSLAGSYPVISLSFANIKDTSLPSAVQSMCFIMAELFETHRYLLESDRLSETEKQTYHSVTRLYLDSLETTDSKTLYEMPIQTKKLIQQLKNTLHFLSVCLYKYFDRKVLILLDEYDTPMQGAYVHGYWDEFTDLIRGMFNAAFKTNPYLGKALLTGITRVSKESIFSDLNNLAVITTTSNRYADCFGLTEEEVFAVMDEQGFSDKEGVKEWYDGFTFGKTTDIYNPWSIINFLKEGKLAPYWANSSSNSLVNKLIREGSVDLKMTFEKLLSGETIWKPIDEQIVYNQLDEDEEAVRSLLLATGYLKAISRQTSRDALESGSPLYELKLTNLEVRSMFLRMVRSWFRHSGSRYNDFIKALLLDDVKMMNRFLNTTSQTVFSYFDTGKSPSGAEPERFYHGFVLGLMADMSDQYILRSNRESGFGRYDVLIYSKDLKTKGIIMEFKVHDPEDETGLEETVQAALQQIEEKNYQAELRALGIPKENIRKYGFAFEGKKVLIGKGIE